MRSCDNNNNNNNKNKINKLTIVELCNKADIGDGADIAFNNHE